MVSTESTSSQTVSWGWSMLAVDQSSGDDLDVPLCNWFELRPLLTFCRLEVSSRMAGEPREPSPLRGLLGFNHGLFLDRNTGPKEEICTAWAVSRILMAISEPPR